MFTVAIAIILRQDVTRNNRVKVTFKRQTYIWMNHGCFSEQFLFITFPVKLEGPVKTLSSMGWVRILNVTQKFETII